MNINDILKKEFNLRDEQINNTIKLIDEGNTIPFIARYRKEVTGGIDEDTIKKINEVYARRRDLMLETMKEEFPEGVEYTYPEGGLFIWVELPKHLDSRIIMKDCLANNVAYVPGGSFFPNGGTENCFRLNYSNMSDDRIVEGIKRIGLVLRKYMAVKQNV